MPKIIELTVEVEVQRVSCPGVWLCQDGRVSLTVFALGTSYQTCLLPPVFPLMFKDVFYFRKRFQETCALNNICCLLKEETIYCELVQWCENCVTGECTILAQYLGALNDVLFPPNMCSNDGVDLLMRRSKEFPGILSPKIEIATKVRIDEVWNHQLSSLSSLKKVSCHCTQPDLESMRQKPVCHSARYHRSKCNSVRRPPSVCKSRVRSRSRSKSRSGGSRSYCSLPPHEHEPEVPCRCPMHKDEPPKYIHRPLNIPCPSLNPVSNPKTTICPPQTIPECKRNSQYCVYDVVTAGNATWMGNRTDSTEESDFEDVEQRTSDETDKSYSPSPTSACIQKVILESNYIDHESPKSKIKERSKNICKTNITPCVCEICKRYYELFRDDLNCES